MTDIADPFRNRAASIAHNLEIEARVGALTDIGRASIVLLVMAVIAIAASGIGWYMGGSPAGLVDGVIAAGSAIALRTHRSRFLAVALLLLSLITLAMFCLSFGAAQGIAQKSGLLSLVAAFFAVKGTFRLAAVEGTRLVWTGIALNLLAFVIYEALTFTVVFIAIAATRPEWFEPANEQVMGLVIYILFLGIMALVCLQYLPFTRRATNIAGTEA